MTRLIAVILSSATILCTSDAAIAASCSGYNEIWKDMAIRLSNSKYMWATLSCDRNCFQMNSGSNEMNIIGNGTNCGNSMQGNWAINACGRSGNFTGDANGVLKEILSYCLR